MVFFFFNANYNKNYLQLFMQESGWSEKCPSTTVSIYTLTCWNSYRSTSVHKHIFSQTLFIIITNEVQLLFACGIFAYVYQKPLDSMHSEKKKANKNILHLKIFSYYFQSSPQTDLNSINFNFKAKKEQWLAFHYTQFQWNQAPSQ